MVEQFEQGEAGGLAVSFYTIDNPEAAEEVRKRFPNAEIITNVSTALETSEARGEIQRPRRRMR